MTQKIWDPELGKQLIECDRRFFMEQRRALLAQVDALERRLGIAPTTADLRRKQKSSIMQSRDE